LIEHQHIGQNANAAKSFQAAHKLYKSRRINRAMTGDLEDEAALNHPGKRSGKSLDPWKAHRLGGTRTQQL
jgi:hypothetical protein